MTTPPKNQVALNRSLSQSFGVNSKQVDVYKMVTAHLVEVLLDCNCIVLAHGPTETGKTFTM